MKVVYKVTVEYEPSDNDPDDLFDTLKSSPLLQSIKDDVHDIVNGELEEDEDGDDPQVTVEVIESYEETP